MMAKNNIKILVSAKHEETILIYDKSRGKYDLFHDGKHVDSFKGKQPNKRLENLILVPKNKFYENINDYPQELIQLNNKIKDLKIEKKQNDFFLKDFIMELLSDTEKQKNLFNTLKHEIKLQYYAEEQLTDIEKVLNNISDEDLEKDNDYKSALAESISDEIKELFQERERGAVEIGRRKLSSLLTIKYGVILRKYIGTIYKENGNGYEPTSHDDLILELTKLFGNNFIHDGDLKKAIGYISKRLEPKPNKIKFENTLFDMEKIKEYKPPRPIFTVLNIPYKYNPNAKSTLMKDFLKSSFERENEEATKEAVKGIKQLTGYLFTSGNSLEILPIFTGLTGAGKSTFLNILTGIFGKDKISGISLQSLENDVHASSGFIGKHLNIIRDSDTTMIKNISILKSWTGNESYPVNPKFKDLFDLPAEEVPKPLLACNTMPVFKVYDDALIRRFVIIEFKVSMTKTGKAIKDLDKKILADNEEVEWFIYESIQAYKEMIENGESFIFKISDEETMELIEKHTHPINHIIHRLICKHDPIAYDHEKTNDLNGDFRPVFTDDLVEAILFISDNDGIDVPVNKNGKIDKRKLLNIIRDEYDLHDGEIVKHKDSGKYTIHRDYTARSERWNGLNKKAYPNLIATKEYINILNEIKKQKNEEE